MKAFTIKARTILGAFKGLRDKGPVFNFFLSKNKNFLIVSGFINVIKIGLAVEIGAIGRVLYGSCLKMLLF
ncbi:hypothetical protein OO009_04575 [Flavobacteriaceae bacterium KMM 6897]|nr:hypothetical protein [Flavobacteriaceae bacterium KMM 6897]MEB8345892.1 hypothetical protein [Flavobacteriaceae bacterium KMM 6898]